MKKIFVLIAIAFCCSCNKPATSCSESASTNDSIVVDTVAVDSVVVDSISM